MGIFDLFKKKEKLNKNNYQDFLNGIVKKYFDGSKSKLAADAAELIELTKFNLGIDDMVALLMRGIGCLELKGDWNEGTANAMRKDCLGKLTNVDLKWILVYCDLHYIHKDPGKEALLMFELAGRQIGMPSPHGDISKDYKFH